MSLVLPREKEVENMFSRILSSKESCERLIGTFYGHLSEEDRYMDPDPHHFAEVLLNAYKNGDVSALLLELCNRSMFDLLKEAYLIPKRFHGKAGENPVLLTDADGNLAVDRTALVPKHEYKKFQPALAEIAELRQLDRLGAAKQRWRFLLEKLSQEEQLQIALSQYANEQNWFELGVDGSIIAKAWDYIGLRLPNAYSQYFDIALSNVNLSATEPQAIVDNRVTKTFAMAIARQESAWNPMAQSSANARGLMQLLPSTAQKTAENQQLPYNGELDLFKPLNNILLGTAHLNELNAKYPNNRILIASAYNAGASRVEKWLARANGKLAMDEFIASIPFFETRGYVQNVLTYDFYYQHLQDKEKLQTFSKEEYDRLY